MEVASQAEWGVRDAADHVQTTTPKQNEIVADGSPEFYWPDGEKEKYTKDEIQDIEDMDKGKRLFEKLQRTEITMSQFMDDYNAMRTPQMDYFVNEYIPKNV